MFFYLKYLKWFISGACLPRVERDEFILTNYNTYDCYKTEAYNCARYMYSV